MTLKLLLNNQIIWIIFIKTFKNTTQIINDKILIIFDMIADMFSNKKLNPVVTELFIRGRKLKISLVFYTQSYFAVPKSIRLNSMHILFNIIFHNVIILITPIVNKNKNNYHYNIFQEKGSYKDKSNTKYF